MSDGKVNNIAVWLINDEFSGMAVRLMAKLTAWQYGYC